MKLPVPFLVASLVLAGVLAGCSSSPKGAGSGKYAAVELKGFSRMAIEMATEQVFVKDGFKLERRANETMIFEKPASTGQNIVWGGWQTGLWDRVVAKVTRLSEDDHFLLSADAFRVTSRGGQFARGRKEDGVRRSIQVPRHVGTGQSPPRTHAQFQLQIVDSPDSLPRKDPKRPRPLRTLFLVSLLSP